MIHIAIVDDDQRFLDALHRELVSWFRTHRPNLGLDVQEYKTASELQSVLQEQRMDLFFLDIEMPGQNGLELASHIRQSFPLSIIVFLTSYEKYAPSGYVVQALRYLSKPIDASQFDEALTAAVNEFERLDQGSLSVITYGNIHRIPYRDILYVRHILRHSLIATMTLGTIKDSRGLNALFEAINDARFLFIDRGTFVNIDHIQRVDGYQLILRNGESLAISRRMLTQVKLTINRLLGGE